MKLELKRIGVWSLVKISFVVNLIFGFILGIFYAFLFALMAALPVNMEEGSSGMFSVFAGVAAILLPFICAIACAVFNTILAAIGGWVYNLIAKATGGIELEYSPVVQMVPATTAPAGYEPPPAGEQTSSI